MRPGRLAAAALLALAACPLPQSVPSVPAGSVTPPRIVEDVVWPTPTSGALGTAGTTFPFDPSCAAPTQTTFTVATTVADENVGEVVIYRWFVDYDPTKPAQYNPLAQSGQLDSPLQEPFTLRSVPPLLFFKPGSYGNAVHVLELVISNGFDQRADQTTLPLPYRSPLIDSVNRFEVQSHKWVFVPVPGCASATPATCPPCT